MTPEQARARQRQIELEAAPRRGALYENIIGSGAIDTPGERFGVALNDMGKSAGSGLGDFAKAMLTLPQTAGGFMDAGMERLTGVPMQSDLPDSAAMTRDAIGSVTDYEPQTTAGRYTKNVATFGPGIVMSPMTAVGAGLVSEGAADLANYLFPESKVAEPIARVVGGVTGPSLLRTGTNLVTGKPLSAAQGAVRSATSADDLAASAKKLYGEAGKLGVTASPGQVQNVIDDALAAMIKDGIIPPSGKVLRGYEKARLALDTLRGYKGQPMTPQQMLRTRTILMDAARSSGNEGRIGSQLVKAFDDVMEPLAPQIKMANKDMAKWFKWKKMDDLAEEAKDALGANYTEAGYLTAVRQKYRALLKRIRDGKEKGWTPEQIAQMEKVVRGGGVENNLRRLGKVAPNNPIFAGAGYSGPAVLAALNGIPAPAIGAAAGATYATGRVASKAASMMQGKNLGILDAMVRGGGAPTAKQGPNFLEILMSTANAGNQAAEDGNFMEMFRGYQP